jgi:hypothetical protein
MGRAKPNVPLRTAVTARAGLPMERPVHDASLPARAIYRESDRTRLCPRPSATSSLTPGRGRSATVYEELGLQRTAFNPIFFALFSLSP